MLFFYDFYSLLELVMSYKLPFVQFLKYTYFERQFQTRRIWHDTHLVWVVATIKTFTKIVTTQTKYTPFPQPYQTIHQTLQTNYKQNTLQKTLQNK